MPYCSIPLALSPCFLVVSSGDFILHTCVSCAFILCDLRIERPLWIENVILFLCFTSDVWPNESVWCVFTRTGLLSSTDQPCMFGKVLAAACKRNLPVMPQKTQSEKPEKRLNLPLCRKGLLDALNQSHVFV